MSLDHVMEIWFNQELGRLRHIGLAKENYRPEKIQFIYFSRMTTKNVLFDKDMISIENPRANNNHRDCAHVTIKNVKGNWGEYFDFRHNKGKAEIQSNAPLQFFETARDASMHED